MRITPTLAVLLLAVVSIGLPLHASDDNTKSLAEIAAFGEAYVEAFGKGDAAALAAMWTPDGDYVDQTGKVFQGREEIAKVFAGFFAANKDLKLGIDSEALKFPTPDTALEDGSTSVIFPDGTPPARGRFSNVFVKQDGKWLLASVRESAYLPSTNAVHLEGLAWAIGAWQTDPKSPEVSHTEFAWGDNGNFIVSRQAITLKDQLISSGTQFIGWDASSSEIRSWNFESDGGFGEGVWTAGANGWSVRTTATLPNGKKLLAVNTISRNDDGSINWQSTDRKLDGKSLPDTEKIKLTRVE